MSSLAFILDRSRVDRRLSSTVEVLTSIWERVLQHSAIDDDANFFDLGGDSISAVQLFKEIAQVYRIKLPAFTICQTPTISDLASLIDQRMPPHCPSRVLLKSGDIGPPIFMLHGLGGSILELCGVARHIRCRNPIYGMQMRGINCGEEPFQRVEDMARFHLTVIKELQPRGPYILIGYSLGGLVMFEMARRFSEEGEKVRLLGMVDSYPHRRFLPTLERLRLAVHLVRRRAFRLTHREPENATGFTEGSALALQMSCGSEDRKCSGAELDSTFNQAIGCLRNRASIALKNYRPPYYHGKINFVRAQTPSWFPKNADTVWGHLAKHLHVDTVPGDHLGMLTRHSQSLAAVLSRYIEESVC